MARGPKKHLKRIRAPKSWMMDKMGGVFVTRPSQGPHKLKESLPLHLILKRKLGYSLNNKESIMILNEKDNEIKIDGKVRRDLKFPVGLMDVITIPKTKDQFRVFYDEKRRFTLLKITDKEISKKLVKIVKIEIGPNKIPYMVTNDARYIRFPDPSYKVGDSLLFNFETQTVEKHFTLAIGHKALVTSGNNLGRIGVVQSIVKKLGNIAVVTLRDEAGHIFNTRIGNIFIIGDAKAAVTLPKARGIRYTVSEIVDRQIENDHKHDE